MNKLKNKDELTKRVAFLHEDKHHSFMYIAKELHIGKETARKLYNESKNIPIYRFSSIDKFDAGKDQALKNAGWDDAKIADEFHITVEQLKEHRSDGRREKENNMV